MRSKKDQVHNNCCKRKQAPKKPAVFAALNYPSNHDGGSEKKNRLQNPNKPPSPNSDAALVDYKGTPPGPNGNPPVRKATLLSRKGWWFRIRPGAAPKLLDGTGDHSRGTVERCTEVTPKTSPNPKDWCDPNDPAYPIHPQNPKSRTKYFYRLVCLNAASLKRLKGEWCGFTWSVALTGQMGSRASGWMPLSAIESGDKAMRTLKRWACCITQYQEWGKSLTRRKRVYKFRTFTQVQHELDKIKGLAPDSKDFKCYFRDNSNNIKSALARCSGKPDFRNKLRDEFGIYSECAKNNRLTDYLPKPDWVGPGAKDYTNLNANGSISKSHKPTMAPIALDVFPAGHNFYRLEFKNKKPILGFLYNPAATGSPIGQLVWYYGYCVPGKKDSKSQRSFGWVPALALEPVGQWRKVDWAKPKRQRSTA